MEQGVDLQRFQQFRKRPAKARRKLNRTYGGEITVPTPRTSTQIKETLKVCYIVFLVYFKLLLLPLTTTSMMITKTT